jgi:hypothetical protein
MYNRDVVPLNADGIMQLFSVLSTDDGVGGELFWSAFDQCNCGQYFLKGFLNAIHGPGCPTWPYIDTPAAPPEPGIDPSSFMQDSMVGSLSLLAPHSIL